MEIFKNSSIADSLAKPDETIEEHTENLLKSLELLISLNYVDTEDSKILERAIIYHDVGKSDFLFTERLKNNTKFDKFKEVPHNILSYYMMYIELNNFSNSFLNENNLASYAIFNHHHYIDNFEYITCEDNRKLILERLLNIYSNLDKKQIEKLDSNLGNIEDLYEENQMDFIKILGLLNKCDYSASAHIPAEFYPNFLENGLDNLLNTWKKEDDKANWNELQNFCKENKKENLIVIAQTGMGKTEAGLHWIGDTKGFFVLPLKTAINSIYNRIINNICNGEEIEEKVALLHSDTLNMYLENFDGEDNDKILSYYENSKKFSIPLNITTPDQIFDFVFRSKGFEFKNAMMSYSKVVIDEIQAYSPELLATLIRGIQDIIEIGGKVCIITATFPPFIKDLLLTENLDYLNEQEQKYKFITKEFTNDMKRHNLKILEDELNAEYICNHYVKNDSKSKKYLVVCNTIKKSQEVFADLKQKGLENVNILHSKFIKKERNEKENKIIEVGKTENIGNEIWISTQIVEASLDIDFDLLFTELSDLNGLFQRLGRVNRKGKKEVNDYNCYVFTEINKNLLKDNKDSKKGFIYKEIYDLSKEAIKQKGDGILTEKDKQNLIKEFFTFEKIKKSSKFLEEYKERYNYINISLRERGIENKDKQTFRDIISFNVFPVDIERGLLNENEINSILNELKDIKSKLLCSKSEDEKIELKLEFTKKLDELMKYTVSVGLYDTKYLKEKIEISKNINLYKVYCKYDEKGFIRLTSEEGKLLDSTGFKKIIDVDKKDYEYEYDSFI
ncbi:CRISPR-associated helicase Cas3' [Parvimonas sp. G1425]|uniref:CRISPR-associated helicase Cas3' n=1 Tax=Parvimonas sp. G1425 TaxID=3387694 RepID=UPI0039E6050D